MNGAVARRIDLIDALRALALIGILQVNIQTFVWGPGDQLGYFIDPPRAVDTAVYLLVGTLVSTKFISLFAFLFGVGFSLQMKKLRRMTGSPFAAQAVYRRRLVFLLLVGVLHGCLLYYGDVLTVYAIAGFVLVLYASARPRKLASAARAWWLAFAALTVFWMAIGELERRLVPSNADIRLIPAELLDHFALGVGGSWIEQLGPRIEDYLSLLSNVLLTGFPFIVGLFLLGALAGRLGWLTRPERYPRLWRAATWIGLAALPFAAVAAWLNYRSTLTTPGDIRAVAYGLASFGSGLACLYVALIVRARDMPSVRAAIRWLAPAGRMPLTNYLMQSVISGVLLTGWGFGLAARLRHAELALLALGIALAQIAASRWWIARFGQGPVEALWRQATYRDSAASSTFTQTPR